MYSFYVHGDKTLDIHASGGEHVRAARMGQRGVYVFHFFKVGNGRSQGQGATQFNVYIGGFPGDKVWLDSGSQAERVMHVESGDAPRFAKHVKMVIDHALHNLSDRVITGCKRIDMFALQVGPVGDIERDQAYGPARVDDDVRGMRIRKNVKFGSRSYIARHAQRATHNDHFAHQLRDTRLAAHSQRDVSERADGYQRNFSRSLHNLLDNHIDGMVCQRLALWVGQRDLAQAIATMHVVSNYRLAHKRAITSARDGYIGASCQFQQGQCVARGEIHMHVATNGSHSLKLYIR